MPDVSAFWSGRDKLTIEARAENAYALILRDSTDIVITRRASANTPKETLPAQTVRIEFNNAQGLEIGENGKAAKHSCTVFGISGHPRVTDTDIKRNDTFTIGDATYRVVDVVIKRGSIQASAEALS